MQVKCSSREKMGYFGYISCTGYFVLMTCKLYKSTIILNILFFLLFFEVQDDLRHLKEQIISQATVSTEVIDLKTLENAIERTEQSVRVIAITAY